MSKKAALMAASVFRWGLFRAACGFLTTVKALPTGLDVSPLTFDPSAALISSRALGRTQLSARQEKCILWL
jgi:hypothetical protein